MPRPRSASTAGRPTDRRIAPRGVFCAACCTAALAVRPARAQRPLNLDFERGSYQSPAFAWGWGVDAPATWAAPPGVARDSTVAHHGRWSLRVVRTAADSGPLAASVSWWTSYPVAPPATSSTASAPGGGTRPPGARPERRRLERLRLTGWVRTDALSGGEATIQLEQYDAVPNSPALRADTLTGRGVRGTTGWTRLVIDVPAGAALAYLSVGVRVTGTRGTAWFDDFALTRDGRPVIEAPGPATPTAAEVAWLRARSTPFVTLEPGGAAASRTDDAGMAAFTRFVGDARIVALGEATHGTREFVEAKHRLFAELVRRRGFSVCFVEENVGPVEQLNHYLRTGAGGEAAFHRALWPGARTAEYRALFAWMRAYNAARPARLVEVAGVDVQDPRTPVDSVLAFLGRADPAFRPAADSAYRDVRAAWAQREYPYVSDSATAAWVAGAARVRQHVEAQGVAYVAAARSAADSAAAAWAPHYAAVAQLAVRLSAKSGSAASAHAYAWRDSAMAATLLWQLDRRAPGTRGILWAHNAHIARAPGQMGERLERLRPGLVRVVALTAAEGAYQASRVTAVGPLLGSDPAQRVSAVAPFDPAPPGSVAGVLAAFGAPSQFVDLRGAAAARDGRWLGTPRPTLSIGWAVDDYPYYADALTGYDGLVFIRRSSPYRPLP